MFKQSHMRSFVAVAGLGSISAAAERLHRSPSAVSMTVANFEEQLGRPLFEPGSKSKLTPFGQYVYAVASEQIEGFDRSMAGIQAYARNDIGSVDIASVPSFATRYLPVLLSAFVEQHPKVTLAIRDDSSEHINILVETGEIDVGIVSLASNIGAHRVEFQPLLTDKLGVVCSQSNSLAALERPLEWQDLMSQTFIANGTCSRIKAPDFGAILSSAEIEVQNTTSLLALIAGDVGVTTLPQLAVPIDREDVVFKLTAYDDLQRTIGVITPKDRTLSPAAEAFLKLTLTYFESA